MGGFAEIHQPRLTTNQLSQPSQKQNLQELGLICQLRNNPAPAQVRRHHLSVFHETKAWAAESWLENPILQHKICIP